MNKKINKKDIHKGLLCVVNKSVDTIIYRVIAISGNSVHLEYKQGNKFIGGGCIDCLSLMYPSLEQYKTSFISLYK